jgi:uncharacterized protein (TIRG00374 family)
MKLRHIFFLLAILGVGYIAANNTDKFSQFISTLKDVNLWVLLLILPIRYLSYYSNTRYFVSFLKMFGHTVGEEKLFRSVVTMNFVNTVFPTGGISGVSYIANALKPKVDSHTTAIAQVFWQAFTVAGYFVFLIIAFLSLFVTSSTERIGFKVILLFILAVIGLGIAASVVLFQRNTTEKISYWATRPINTVLHFVKRNALGKERLDRFFDDFYGSIAHMRADKARVRRPIMWAFAGLFFEIASVYIVFVAFGQFVNPGVVIAGYSLAILFSMASFFTAGVGVYEATMVATFVALGQPLGLSLSVTLVYRTIALWLFLPVGLYFYKRDTIDGK